MAGRKKGTAKTGGRQKGTRNKLTVDAKARIEKEADPLGFLIKLVRGEKIKVGAAGNPVVEIELYPTMEQRQRAAEKLLAKIVPDMKALEVAGDKGGPVTFVMNLTGDQ